MSSLHRRWLLTGGIGSGKSEVRRLLTERGVRTLDADSIGHAVLDDEAREAVSKRWPEVMVDDVVDRSRLARVVFAEPEELAALETITHPLIFGRILSELEGFEGVAVVEIPLIDLELGWPRMVVDALEGIRIERAMARGMPRDDVKRRMATQPTRADWLASADLVIPNHGSLTRLSSTVDKLVSLLAQ